MIHKKCFGFLKNKFEWNAFVEFGCSILCIFDVCTNVVTLRGVPK